MVYYIFGKNLKNENNVKCFCFTYPYCISSLCYSCLFYFSYIIRQDIEFGQKEKAIHCLQTRVCSLWHPNCVLLAVNYIGHLMSFFFFHAMPGRQNRDTECIITTKTAEKNTPYEQATIVRVTVYRILQTQEGLHPILFIV